MSEVDIRSIFKYLISTVFILEDCTFYSTTKTDDCKN